MILKFIIMPINKLEQNSIFSKNESKEIKFIKNKIENNSWFVDIGSNIGLYSLNISNINTKYKKVETFQLNQIQ